MIPAPPDNSRATFPRHLGQVFTGSAVMDWNFSNRWPHLRHSYSYVGMVAYPSRISAGSWAFNAAFTFSWKPFAASSVNVPALDRYVNA